jgi:hypothetical protein
MSGGMAGAMQQRAPVEQRAAMPSPLFGNMQGNLMNQFAARMMMPAMPSGPIQQLMMGAQPQQNQYQQTFQNMLPGLTAPPSIPTMAAPYNPRGASGGLMGPQPAAPPTPFDLSGVNNVNGLSNDQILNYLNYLPENAMPGYAGE